MNDEIVKGIISNLLVKLDDEFITQCKKIYCYCRADGSVPAKEFLDAVDARTKAAYVQMFRTHCQGHRLRGEKWKPLQNCEGLFEYKDNGTQTRIIHAFEIGSLVILLYGFGGKKENKIEKGHIKEERGIQRHIPRSY